MMRSIAKILIQYFYDSCSSRSNAKTPVADPLPGWLRNWIERDRHLAKFELELKQLESQLVSQSGEHLKDWRRTEATNTDAMIGLSTQSVSWKRSPMALAALAAGLSCLLLTAGWFAWKSSPRSNAPVVANVEPDKANSELINPNERSHRVEPAREELLRSTWEATKRLATDWKQKSGSANRTLALVNQDALDKQIRELSGEGLRFVAQKLPRATVRMLGMNTVGNGH